MSILARMFPQPLLSIVILVLWAGLAPAPTPGQILLGAVLAVAIPLITRPFWPNPPSIVRPLAGLRLIGVVLYDIVTANIEVARQVLGPIPALRPAFLEIPVEIEDPFVATVFGSIISLTPGTVSVDIDTKRRMLLVHALSVEDTGEVIRRVKSRYETPLKEIFGC
jgi:multicomponent K+:H+ antiporter subunit E